MKKLLALLLAPVMVLSLAACGEDEPPENHDDTQSSQTPAENLQKISVEGLHIYVDASYAVHEGIVGELYCGIDTDGYTITAVEIYSYDKGDTGYLWGSSEELADTFFLNPEQETRGEQNGVHYRQNHDFTIEWE